MSHSMTLEEFAALSDKPIPEGAGTLTVITPDLAEALNTLVGVAAEVANGETSRTALRIALGQLKELHNYEQVRLGGTPR